MPTILDMKLRDAVRRLTVAVTEVTLAAGKGMDYSTVFDKADRVIFAAEKLSDLAASGDKQPEAE